jgi:transcriptional antiterminator RfaH
MYLFARFDFARYHRFVRHTLGVNTIVHFGSEVGTIADEVVRELQSRCAADSPIPIIQIDPPVIEGDSVVVDSGPFHGVQALVTKVLPAKERVRILIEMLGRQVEVEMGAGSILVKAPPRAYL